MLWKRPLKPNTTSMIATPGANDRNSGGVVLTLHVYALPPCTDVVTSDLHVTLTFPAGINNNSDAFGINIVPNPSSSGIFSLKVTGVMDQDLSITVTDQSGKTVFRDQAKPTSKDFERTINLSSSPRGIYLVKVQTGTNVKVEKMIIQ